MPLATRPLLETAPVAIEEVRQLAREQGVDIPPASLPDALELAEEVVRSKDFDQLDEVFRQAWQGVLKTLKGAARLGGKTIAGAFLLGPVLATRLARRIIQRAKSGTADQVPSDESFSIGDTTFRPAGSNRWKARLRGGYAMQLRYDERTATFAAEVENQPLGSWAAEDLAYAIQTAYTISRARADGEPEIDDVSPD